MSASNLRCRIEFYHRSPVENTLGEKTYEYIPLCSAWANLTPQSGKIASLEGNVERAEITHKATIRASVLPQVPADIYFLFRGQRYDVLYAYPIYNRAGWLELFCRLVVENCVESHGHQRTGGICAEPGADGKDLPSEAETLFAGGRHKA